MRRHNPSVLAGVDGKSSARQLSEHNLGGTLNLLEYCREREAGLNPAEHQPRVLDCSRWQRFPCVSEQNAFQLDDAQSLPPGVSAKGIDEQFSTGSPISLYGATKLASEVMALEYGLHIRIPGVGQSLRCAGRRRPVWHRRAGDFFLSGSTLMPRRYPLKYIGFRRAWLPGA